ncbi:MAG: hypothetical protein Q4D11_04340 [Rhodospirillales bacterium]|nr:hypothetical protein [Rhodospirillales bacterium]
MDARTAARVVNSGRIDPKEFQTLYAALKDNPEFVQEFNALRMAMLKEYAKGESMEVKQSGYNVQREDVITVTEKTQDDHVSERLVDEGNVSAVAPEHAPVVTETQQPVVVHQKKNVESWKVQYRQDILQLAVKTKEVETPVIEAIKDGGLRADLKNGTILNFASENNVSVATEEEPKAQDFDILVALAKNNNKKIKLGEEMSDEFRRALVEACAKENVMISNLSLEDLDLYMSNLPAPEQKLDTVEKNQEAQNAPVHTVADIQPVKDEEKVAEAHAAEVKQSEAEVETIVVPAAEEKQSEADVQVVDDKQPVDEVATVAEENQPEAEVQTVTAPTDTETEEKVRAEVEEQTAAIKAAAEKEIADAKAREAAALAALAAAEQKVATANSELAAAQAEVEAAATASKEEINAANARADAAEKALEDARAEAEAAKQEAEAAKEQKEEKEQAAIIAPVVEEKQPEAEVQVVDDKPAIITPLHTPVVEEKQPEAEVQVVDDKQPVDEVATVVEDQPADEPKEVVEDRHADEEQVVIIPEGQEEYLDNNEENFIAEEHDQGNAGIHQHPIYVDAPEDEARAEEENEPKKKGFFARMWDKIKNNKIVKRVLIGAAVVGAIAFGVSRCNPKKAAPVKDNVKDKVEQVVAPVDTTAHEKADTATITLDPASIADVEWDSSKKVSEARWNAMKKFANLHNPMGFRTELDNAAPIAEAIGSSPEEVVSDFQYASAWFSKVTKDKCDTHNSQLGTLKTNDEKITLRKVMQDWAKKMSGCDDEIGYDVNPYIKSICEAVTPSGQVNIVMLDNTFHGLLKYNRHGDDGMLIGENNNRAIGLNRADCEDTRVEILMGQVRKAPAPVVEEYVVEELEPVVKTPVVEKDTIIPTIQPVKLEAPVITPPDTIKIETPAPEPAPVVSVGSQMNDEKPGFREGPAHQFGRHAEAVSNNGSDTKLTKAQKNATNGLLKDVHKKGEITAAQLQQGKRELDR